MPFKKIKQFDSHKHSFPPAFFTFLIIVKKTIVLTLQKIFFPKVTMRKSITLLFLLCFVVSKLSASETLGQRHLSVQGEFLWLFPMISQSYYAVDRRSIFPVGNRTNNEVGFRPAYRVLANYGFCDCFSDLQVRWTHLPHMSTTDTKSGNLLAAVSPPLIVNSLTLISASSKIRLDYWATDISYGFWAYQYKCLDLFLRTGVHIARIEFKESLRYRSVSPVQFMLVKNTSRVFGLGPELDFDMRYTFPCQNRKNALALISSFRAAFLASRYHAINRSSVNTTTTTSLVLADDTKRWDFISFWDVRLGFNYTLPFNCFCVDLEAGYELFSYRNAIDRIYFSDSTSRGSSIDNYSDANFQGPYVALRVTF